MGFWYSLLWIVILDGVTICSCFAQTEDIQFRRFSDEEGLPNNLFRLAIQARDGLIWMGGIGGLATYDGYDVQMVRHSSRDTQTIIGNNISALYEDDQGRLWVGAFGGGLCYSNRSKTLWHRIPLKGKSQHHGLITIQSITSDSLGQVWVATDAGLWVLQTEADQVIPRLATALYDAQMFDPEFPKINVLLTDMIGRVWIGTDSGLYIFNPVNRHLSRPGSFHALPETEIQDLAIDQQQQVWVSCVNKGPRLFYADPDALDFHSFDGISFASDSRLVRIAFDKDNRIWAASFGDQAYAYDFTQQKLFFQSGLSDHLGHERFFRKPFIDHSGDVWLPCEGFYIYPYPKGFLNYQHPFAFHQSATCIFAYGDEQWFAYREKGIVLVDGPQAEARYLSTESQGADWIPVDHIQAIHRKANGEYIIVGFSHVFIWDKRRGVIRDHRISGTNRSILKDSQGRYWIGGIFGLHLLDENKGVIQTYALPQYLGDDRNFVQTILEDARGRIWFCTDLKGLAVLEPSTGKLEQLVPLAEDENSLPTLSIIDMDMDQEGILWLATDVGLVKLDPETRNIQTFTASDGLESDYITAVICTPDHQVWMSTHKGISVLNTAENRFSNFNKGDGILNSSFYPRCKFLSASGELFFGGKMGVDHFRPTELRQNPFPPKLLLSGIWVDQQSQPLAFEGDGILPLKIHHQNQLIEFGISGIHHNDQAGLQYIYKVDDVHQDWVNHGTQRKIVFARFPPGQYLFRARAVTRDGVSSEDELQVPFTILPPFYGTIWFRILAIVAIAGLIIWYVRFREKQIRRKDRKEMEINRKMADLEKRALQSQMNPHFIYNAMNSIQQFMIERDMEGAMRYLTRFSRILRTVLNLSNLHRVPLSDELKLIEDYLELENMRFPNKFTFSIHVDPALNIHTAEIPPFFIQPQVENAIRHGLLKKEGQGHLQINLDQVGQDIRIVVEDNGIGRQAARYWKHQEGSVEESKGLAIVQERLSHLHAGNGKDSFIIHDLTDPDGKPIGTRVEVSIPLD